jgi:hypothetical protein
MSMNLCFLTRHTRRRVNFPFQTPTDLTYAVMDAKSNFEKRKLLEQFMDEQKWFDDTREDTLTAFDRLMADTNLQLSIV